MYLYYVAFILFFVSIDTYLLFNFVKINENRIRYNFWYIRHFVNYTRALYGITLFERTIYKDDVWEIDVS